MRKLLCLIVVAFSLFTTSALTSFAVMNTDNKEIVNQWVNYTDKITMEQEDAIQSAVVIATLNGTLELKRTPKEEYFLCGNVAKNRRFAVKVSKEDWEYFTTWVLR